MMNYGINLIYIHHCDVHLFEISKMPIGDAKIILLESFPTKFYLNGIIFENSSKYISKIFEQK